MKRFGTLLLSLIAIQAFIIGANVNGQDFDIPLAGGEDMRWIFPSDDDRGLITFGAGGIVAVWDSAMIPVSSFRLDRSRQVMDVVRYKEGVYCILSQRNFRNEHHPALQLLSVADGSVQTLAEVDLPGERVVIDVADDGILCIVDRDTVSVLSSYNDRLEQTSVTELPIAGIRKFEVLRNGSLLFYQRAIPDSINLHVWTANALIGIGTIAVREESNADNKPYQRVGALIVGEETLVYGSSSLHRLSGPLLDVVSWEANDIVILTGARFDDHSIMLVCGNQNGGREYWKYDLNQGWSEWAADSIPSTVHSAFVSDGEVWCSGSYSRLWRVRGTATSSSPMQRPTTRSVSGFLGGFVLGERVSIADGTERDAISMIAFNDGSMEYSRVVYDTENIIRDAVPALGGQIFLWEDSPQGTKILQFDPARNITQELNTEQLSGAVRGIREHVDGLYTLTDERLYRYSGAEFSGRAPGFRAVVTDTTEQYRAFLVTDSAIVYASSKRIYRYDISSAVWISISPFESPVYTSSFTRVYNDRMLIGAIAFSGVFTEYNATTGTLTVHQTGIGELITDVAPAGNAEFWIVTAGGKLFRFDPLHDELELVAASPGSSYRIKNLVVEGNHVLLYNYGAREGFVSILTDTGVIEGIEGLPHPNAVNALVLHPNPVRAASPSVRFNSIGNTPAMVYLFDTRGACMGSWNSDSAFPTPGRSGAYLVVIVDPDGSTRSARLLVQ